MTTARAVAFIDGNNWYHSLRAIGVPDPGRLDYAKITRKLVRHRTWIGTRYYIGQVEQSGDNALYAAQRRFLHRLRGMGPLISVHFGRLEQRKTRNAAAAELQQLLGGLKVRMDHETYGALAALARSHRETVLFVEKAVDVMLAVDMVVMAERDEFDTAYLLSADGDFTPAVEAIRRHGKQVFAVAGRPGGQLRRVCNAFLHIDKAWLRDCYLDDG